MAEAESSILIVDDDSEDLALLEKALEPLGCKTHAMTDPHELLPTVYREQPDVVVLDALLPGLSGLDLCKQIKTDEELKGIQVVIVTGVYLRPKHRREALQLFKADGFLTKPFRAPELQRLVVELLAKKTRKPPSSFLSRLGLPSKMPSPKKRGLLGRLFGKEEEPVPAGIEPSPRARKGELPKSKSGKVPSPETASEPNSVKESDTLETMPGEAAPAAALTEALQNGTETAPAVQALPEVPDPEDKDATETEAAASNEPITTEEPATDAASDDNDESASRARTVTRAAPPQAVQALDAAQAGAADEPTADEEAEVEWNTEKPAPRPPEPEATPESESVAEPKTEPKLEAPSEAEKKTHPEPVVTARAQAPAGPSQVEKPEPDAAASSPLAVQRPRFRVGDVPIYDEEDFYSELKRELSKCRRVDRPLTLILIQVDDLTQIVELFGKEIREAVLWHVAEQAMAALREVDVVGMMSSKDLIALTAFASDKYGGGRVVARMRKLLEKNPFRVGEELPPIVPALQFGISSFPDDGDEVVGLIAKAYEDIER